MIRVSHSVIACRPTKSLHRTPLISVGVAATRAGWSAAEPGQAPVGAAPVSSINVLRQKRIAATAGLPPHQSAATTVLRSYYQARTPPVHADKASCYWSVEHGETLVEMLENLELGLVPVRTYRVDDDFFRSFSNEGAR